MLLPHSAVVLYTPLVPKPMHALEIESSTASFSITHTYCLRGERLKHKPLEGLNSTSRQDVRIDNLVFSDRPLRLKKLVDCELQVKHIAEGTWRMSYRLETPALDPIHFDTLRNRFEAQNVFALRGSWEMRPPGLERERQFEKHLARQAIRNRRKRVVRIFARR